MTDDILDTLLDIMNDTGEVPKLPEGAQDWKGKNTIKVPKPGFTWSSGGTVTFPENTDSDPLQSGSAPGWWIEDDILEEPKCTCGADSVGAGLHSDWCDKYEE